MSEVLQRGLLASSGEMIRQARAVVGFDDLGTGWREGFDRLLGELDRAEMSPAHREAAAHRFGVFLQARLHAMRGWHEIPESLGTTLKAPVIIAGLVRSGTTALHKLMSMDPQFQGVEHWLTLAPMKRPPRAAWMRVPAYRAIAGYLDAQIEIAPELKTEHTMAADEVEETLFILAHSFTSNFFASMFDVPEYDSWHRGCDPRPAYDWAADCLRLIGHGDERTWLLKNPGDLLCIDALLATFPDARIIQTHRDPVQAIPSIANLIWSTRKMVMGPQTSALAVGPRESALWAQAVETAHAAQTREPGRFLDVDFNGFLRTPMETIGKIYAHFGLPLSAEAERAMGDWIAAHPRGEAPMQRFRPEDFGLTVDRIKQDFAAYRDRRGYH